MSQLKKTGMVLCGFGRAGQIHFDGIRSSHLCKLLYVVDLVEEESVRSRIQAKLDMYMMGEVKLVGRKSYEEVRY
jgi:hypothetical protein